MSSCHHMLGRIFLGSCPFGTVSRLHGDSASPSLWLTLLPLSIPIKCSAFAAPQWYQIDTLWGICTSFFSFSYGSEISWKVDYYSAAKISFLNREKTLKSYSKKNHASSAPFLRAHSYNEIITLILIIKP